MEAPIQVDGSAMTLADRFVEALYPIWAAPKWHNLLDTLRAFENGRHAGLVKHDTYVHEKHGCIDFYSVYIAGTEDSIYRCAL